MKLKNWLLCLSIFCLVSCGCGQYKSLRECNEHKEDESFRELQKCLDDIIEGKGNFCIIEK